MGRGDYTTTKKGDEYFEKGQNLYRDGNMNLLRADSKKPCLFSNFRRIKKSLLRF
jgi:hypothetical protein